MKHRLVGAFKKLDSLNGVCENLRYGLHRGFSDRPWFCGIFALHSVDFDFALKSPKNPPFHCFLEYDFTADYKLVLAHYKWTTPSGFKQISKAIDRFEHKITSTESCIAHSALNNLTEQK